MPKRRVPGHIQRAGRGRRRVDQPLPPQGPRPAEAPSPEDGDDEVVSIERPVSGAAVAPVGRPLRPTMRQGAASRFVRSAAPVELDIDYEQVMHDLRQIGVLAALAFVVLIALAFVIH
jgi:hypothetical protein